VVTSVIKQNIETKKKDKTRYDKSEPGQEHIEKKRGENAL
jgi:hypothetical protein